jgi:large subunit ribosomal protein L25
MDRVKLQVRPREGRGSKDAKALRAAGDIPGVIYSATTDTQAIVVNARALRQAVSGGLHTILDVTLDGDGQTRPVLIKDLQLDPVRGRVVHIDLHEIRLDQVIQTVIPVHLEGHAEGVNMGGALNQPVHELHVDALPADLVDFISVDVSALEIGQSIRLSDLEAPPGVTFTDDLESTVIATIAAPVSEDELKTEAELEAEAEAEAEAAAAAEAAAEAGEEGAEPGEGGEEAGGEPSGDDSSE